MNEDAKSVISKANTLESELNRFKANWREAARYFKPQLDIDHHNPQSPDSTGFPGLFDTTGIEALDTYANGIIAEAFSITQKWIIFVPQDELEVDDEGKKWYNKCSEIALAHISRSSFYQDFKPAVTDMGCGGTGSLYLEKGDKNLLSFKYDRLGTFAIEKDHEGDIRTEFRWMEMTATEIVDKFGENNIGDKVKSSFDQENQGQEGAKFNVIHGVFPRKDGEEGLDAKRKAYASLYVCEEDENILEHGGYDYFPFAPVRAEIWNDYNYGIGPAQKALPAMRELNKIRRDVHEGVSLAVKPPWLVPSGMVDEISNKPNGVTVYDERDGAKPEHLTIKADIKAGMMLMEDVRAQVRDFFHAALFEAVAQKDKQMTAREIAAIENAALRRFLPSFNQITTELSPIFKNVFLILFEAGVFPEPPESVRVYPEANKPGIVPLPKVEFTSRVALALQMIENGAIDRLLERLLPVMEIAPELADNFDLDEMIRTAARNDGIPEDLLKRIQEVSRLRKERASQMAQQAQQEQMAMAAQTAKDASAADPQKLGELGAMAQNAIPQG